MSEKNLFDENICRKKYLNTSFYIELHEELDKEIQRMSKIKRLSENRSFMKSAPTVQIFYSIQCSIRANEYIPR